MEEVTIRIPGLRFQSFEDAIKDAACGVDRTNLLWTICQCYSLDELKQVCFELRVDHGKLDCSTRDTLARELLEFLERSGRLKELVQILHRDRPRANLEGCMIYTIDITDQTKKILLKILATQEVGDENLRAVLKLL